MTHDTGRRLSEAGGGRPAHPLAPTLEPHMTETTNPQPDRYRHRTAEIEAVQWTGSNADQMRAFCGPDFDEIDPEDRIEDPDQTAAVREADHGTWRGLAPGDWVVKLGGELYEFSAADFTKRYEPAAVPSAPADRDATRAAALREAVAEMKRDALGVIPRLLRMADEAQQPEPQATDDATRLAKVVRWVTSEVVTAKTEFGNGYRAAQRDIRDLVKGRFDNDAAPAAVSQPGKEA